MSAKKFSVIVCTFNGSARIRETLKSLRAQQYPKADYEIIVIDDGSTDETAKVVRSFRSVRLVSYHPNKGISTARNTGLQEARGKWVAFIDDDCIADPNWLKELEQSLQDDEVLGVGGRIEPARLKTLAQRYVFRSGYGRPADVALGQASSPFARLKAYVKDKFAQVNRQDGEPLPVQEIYGANCAFPTKKLRFAGGYDLAIRAAEDVEICHRLRRTYPTDHFVYNPQAKIQHEYMPSFLAYLKKIFGRQDDTVTYYRHLGKMVPLFPFPVFFAVMSAILGSMIGWWALPVVFVMPLGLYSWWTMAAIRFRNPEYALYAIMQLAEESARLVGIIWALTKCISGRWRHAILLAGLLGAAVVARLEGGDLFHLPLALMVVFLPGYLLARILRLQLQITSGIARLVLWAPLGLGWLLLVTFLAAIIGPQIGVTRPLDPWPLSLAVLASVILLVPFALRMPFASHNYKSPRLKWDAWVLGLTLPLMLLGIFVGTGLLNNGYSSAMSAVSLLLGLGALLFVSARLRTLPKSAAPLTLFAVSLALVWAYSLRSSFVFGWDIQQEYAVLQATQAAGAWVITHTPYNAMLSLTTLPAGLASVSGLSGLAVLKVFFPILFSLVPPLLYLMYSQFAKQRWAFIAAAVFISQFAFMQQFAGMVRQQLGFLFFATLTYAMLQPKRVGRSRTSLMVLSVAALVVTHYSTLYVAIILFGLAWLAGRLVHRRPLRRYVSGWAVVGMILGALVWYGPVTQMSAAYVAAQHGTLSVESLKQKYVKHDSAPASTEEYLAHIGAQYDTKRPYLSYYDATNQGVAARQPAELAARWPALQHVTEVGDALVRMGWWIAGLIGIALFGWRARLQREQQYVEFSLIGGAALLLFALAHIFPQIETFYNVSRLNQQCLMFVALPAVLAIAWLLGRRAERAVHSGLLGVVGFAFLFASGLLAFVVGGTPTANLHNQGADYQRFYTQQQDAAAAQWLDKNFQAGTVIYADRYAQLILTSHTTLNQGALTDVTPDTVSRGGYVFATTTNIQVGVAASGKSSQVYTYEFPQVFLKNEKNILYANGGAQVYK